MRGLGVRGFRGFRAFRGFRGFRGSEVYALRPASSSEELLTYLNESNPQPRYIQP